MNLLLPEGSIHSQGITLHINLGSFQERFIAISSLKAGDVLVTEVTDDEYELMRPLLVKFGTEFKVVINVPDIPSPRSFLYEEDVDHVISFDQLEIADKSDTDKFLAELEGTSSNEETISNEYEDEGENE
jgi:hypothetical protein